MLILSIIFFIISILLVIWSAYVLLHTHKINKDIDDKNKKLLNDYKCLSRTVQQEKDYLYDIQNNISKTLNNQKLLSQQAFENYCEVLDNNYKETEEEYNSYEQNMKTAYHNLQLQYMKETEAIKADLDKIKETRTAAIQAITREKEIEEQLAFYCLQVSNNDLKDIAVLESVKPKLINPRILSMLIWQTYWRTPMTNLCNNVIGNTTKTGIYKITNQKTKECYIGQAVDLASRWKDHAKCGLGIDTPPGNKLYKAIQEYGIWSFSWEVLEICSKDQLNEKEKYYIGLYDSKNYGYNSTSGNK